DYYCSSTDTTGNHRVLF
nr:immunoglobulin light chain junction region [Macaca mulatta]MOV73759.1 immunoglobulin light chain junction region [Macaca mulatta]